MPDGTLYDEFDTTDEVVTEIIDNGKYDIPALPAVGTPVEVDELYTDDGNVYRVRQSHNVTIYDPDDIPALFTLYRKESASMDWVRGEQVDVGVIRLDGGVQYECMQAHQTELGWEPSTTPALWNKVTVGIPVWVQPTGAHDAYQTGDQVHFPAIDDPIYESLIDANVWSPTGYPAGWKTV